MFLASSVAIVRSYRCTLGNWYVSCRLCDLFLAESGWNEVASNIQNLFGHKTLHVSGIFCAHHQELSLYTRQMVRFMQVMWPLPSKVRLELRSNLTLLGGGQKICTKRTICQVYSDNSWWWAEKMPETCRVVWQNKFWIFYASSWLFYTKLVTMHGHLNIDFYLFKTYVHAVYLFIYFSSEFEGINNFRFWVFCHCLSVFEVSSDTEW
jgi:hypothetical protein